MTKFHVYIIESPSPMDLYEKRFEGEALTETLRLADIESSHRLTVNKKAFEAAFGRGLADYIKAPGFLPPMIHISAHGDEDGIELTDGDRVTWTELRDLIKPINKAMNGYLLVCLSACQGFSGGKMSMIDDDFPCIAVVGSMGEPTWSETNIGFATFYHLFSKGKHITEAVKAMKLASGHDDFEVFYSQDARQAYLNVGKVKQDIAVEKFEKNMPANQPNNLAKALS